MRSSRLVSLAAMAGLVLASLGGVFTGLALAERANEQHVEVLALTDPQGVRPEDIALRSAAGFTGFEPTALAGVVTRTGETTVAEDGVFAVASGPASMRVATDSLVRLYRIEAAQAPLAAGDIVVVRKDDGDLVEAMLRLPPDLRENVAR